MSMTPILPDRCAHVGPLAIEPAEGGYAAVRCLRCGTTGPSLQDLRGSAKGIVGPRVRRNRGWQHRARNGNLLRFFVTLLVGRS